MLPIKIINGMATLVISKQKQLTPRQLANVAHTREVRGDESADRYLASLMGFVKDSVRMERVQCGRYETDTLAQKPKGTIAKMFRDLQDNDEDTDHTPSDRNLGQWVGVEIECYYPSISHCTDDCDHDNDEYHCDMEISDKQAHQTIRMALTDAGVTRASVKSDGSLESDDGIGCEITILFNTADGYNQLSKVCKVLNDLGCFLNKKCGLHVHLDARHLKPRRAKALSDRLGYALPILKWVVDRSRHDNHYCKMHVSPFKRNCDRYFAINNRAYFAQKTIEVRMHGGSTNFTKIKNWIELLKFISTSKISQDLTTFQDLIDLGLPDNLIEYTERRITNLNPKAWNIIGFLAKDEAG